MNTPDMLMMAVALLVAIAIAGGLYTHRLGLSHLLIFLAVGMLAGVDGPWAFRSTISSWRSTLAACRWS